MPQERAGGPVNDHDEAAHDEAAHDGPVDGAGGPPGLDRGLGFRLGRVHRIVREGWERRIADLGLTPAQAAALRAVDEEPGGGLRDLARRTRTDAMNARRLVQRLEELGLVVSTADPSHRQRRGLHPTPRGAVAAGELATRSAAWNAHVAGLLGAEEYRHLQHLLARLETLLVAGDDDPARGAP